VPPQAEVIDAFGKHPGEEKGVIADVFAHLALAVERGCRPKHGIRFHQHLADIGQRLAFSIADPEQFLDIAKLGHQVGDVVHDLRVAQSNLFGIVPAHEFDEQLLQGMRFRNHSGSHLLFTSPTGARFYRHFIFST